MRSRTIAFLFGCLTFQLVPELPSAIVAFLLLGLLLAFHRVKTRGPFWLIAGFLWYWLHAAWVLSEGVPQGLEGEDLLISGRVASLPETDPRRTRFEFEAESAAFRERRLSPPGRLRLSWYGRHPVVHIGERWQLRVRLKRPHGLMNPGGFDYEKWLFSRRIRATGYVRASPLNRRLASPGRWQFSGSARGWLRERLSANTNAGEPLFGIIPALALGDREGVTQAQWQVLRSTGTSHLIAISGLHVGMVAGLALLVVRWLWGRSAWLAQRVPAQLAGAVAGMVAATGYASLAGFALPTQRALVMAGVVVLTSVLRRSYLPSRSLAVALLLVLLWDPLAVLSAGFWLSFLAVAAILFGMAGRLGERGLWWRWGRVQLVVALALAPLTLGFFQQASLVSPVANLIAVPWVGFVVVPLTLLGVVFMPLSSILAGKVLSGALVALDILWPLLEALAQWPLADWRVAQPPGWVLLASAVGIGWLLAPAGWPSRWVGIVWVLPLVLSRPPAPDPGEAWMTVLDVGQGLSVVIRTKGHVLLYDTGPRFGPTFDTGRAVVVPFLQHEGVDVIDSVIISHEGRDHRGGLESVMEEMGVRRLLTGDSRAAREAQQQPCRRGQRWVWDGVVFTVLHPPRGLPGNNGSCVLRIQSAGASAVLAGDIESVAERVLLQQPGLPLSADVLVAPHHGSKTSSSPGFVAAIQPQVVVFSTGYRNRYGFPHPSVVRRYQRAGAFLYNTARHGAVTICLGPNGIESSRSVRGDQRAYWR